jgi:hypothetical protein
MHAEPLTYVDQPKARCFGNSAALCAEATVLQKTGEPTVNLEVAPKNQQQVQWANKVTLQLGVNELPLLAALCLGYLPNVEFKRPNKGITIERQAQKLFIKASQSGGGLFVLPIPMAETYQLCTLVLSQLHKSSPTNDSGLILAALKGAAALYRAQNPQSR